MTGVNMERDQLLHDSVKLLESALTCLMEVKNEVGVDMANKVYKAVRVYEKYQEKLLKDLARG